MVFSCIGICCQFATVLFNRLYDLLVCFFLLIGLAEKKKLNPDSSDFYQTILRKYGFDGNKSKTKIIWHKSD